MLTQEVNQMADSIHIEHDPIKGEYNVCEDETVWDVFDTKQDAIDCANQLRQEFDIAGITH